MSKHHFGSVLRQHPRHPDKGDLDPCLELRVLKAEINEVEKYLDSHIDLAPGLRALMKRARDRILA